MKKILIIGLIIISILLIYSFTKDKNIFYLNISDTENPYTVFITDYISSKNRLEKYINNFSLEDYRITSLINDINENKSININGRNQSIKNALVKADLITLSIGSTDLYYKLTCYDVNEMYEYVDSLLIDYEELFRLIRKITKEKIIVFGYTSLLMDKIEIIDYFNNKLQEKCLEYKIDFMKINSETENNLKKEINSLLNRLNVL